MAGSFRNFRMHVVIRSINTLFPKCPYRIAYKRPLVIITFPLAKYPAMLWEAALTKKVQKGLGLFSIHYTYISLHTNIPIYKYMLHISLSK